MHEGVITRKLRMKRSDMFKAPDARVPNTPTEPPVASDEADARRSSAVLLVARDLSIDEPCRDALADAGVECVFTASSNELAL